MWKEQRLELSGHHEPPGAERGQLLPKSSGAAPTRSLLVLDVQCAELWWCLPCKLQCVVTQETNAHSVTQPFAAHSVPRLAYTAVECKRKLEFWFCF